MKSWKSGSAATVGALQPLPRRRSRNFAAANNDPAALSIWTKREGRKSLFGRALPLPAWHVGSVCMKMLVADGQRQVREAMARGENVAIWGPSPGFSRSALDPAGACRGHHPRSQTGIESKRLSESRAPAGAFCRPASSGVNQRGEEVLFDPGDRVRGRWRDLPA